MLYQNKVLPLYQQREKQGRKPNNINNKNKEENNMKTRVTTTRECTTLGAAFLFKAYDNNPEVFFTSGKTEYRRVGTVLDNGNMLIVGASDKTYKVFNISKNEMRSTTLTVVETEFFPEESDCIEINNDGDTYVISNKELQGSDLEVGKLYGDSCHKESAIVRLLDKNGALLKFEVVYEPKDSLHYSPIFEIGANCGYWYPVNDGPDTEEYVGANHGTAYYATSRPAVPSTMKEGSLYATPANSIGERDIYELVQVEDGKYLTMQIKAGSNLEGAKGNGITTFMSAEYEWFQAYSKPGKETKVGDYLITPEVVSQSSENMVFGGLYADVNAENATIFQYKGVSELGTLQMKVLYNGADYSAETGSVIGFPAGKGTFNRVKYSN